MQDEFLDMIASNKAMILKICRFHAHCKETVEDLYQEIALNLWKGYPKFRNNPQCKPSTWLYRVAMNTALASTRHQTSDYESITERIAEGTPNEDSDETRLNLYDLIQLLNMEERTLIYLYLDELPHHEIADILGIFHKQCRNKNTENQSETKKIKQPRITNMELEMLKEMWQDINKHALDTKGEGKIDLSFERRFNRYRNYIEAVVCLLTATLLIVIIANKLSTSEVMTVRTHWICTLSAVLSLYTLVKGIFTLFFAIKTSHKDMCVSSFSLTLLRNDLYFVYEQMVWLWGLAPLTITISAVVARDFSPFFANHFGVLSAVLAFVYILALTAFSHRLIRKHKTLTTEITEIETSK